MVGGLADPDRVATRIGQRELPHAPRLIGDQSDIEAVGKRRMERIRVTHVPACHLEAPCQPMNRCSVIPG